MLGAGGGATQRALGAYLRARGIARPCLAVVGWEGGAADVARRRKRTLGVLRRAGGLRLGRRPGNAWEVAAAITFLAEPAASYITGASLFVDGALGLMGPQAAGALTSADWRHG